MTGLRPPDLFSKNSHRKTFVPISGDGPLNFDRPIGGRETAGAHNPAGAMTYRTDYIDRLMYRCAMFFDKMCDFLGRWANPG